VSDLDRKQCFPSTWVETLALEYAKAHVMEAKTPVEFANLYIESVNQIRESLEKTYGKSKG
jgi:hypothetical protein